MRDPISKVSHEVRVANVRIDLIKHTSVVNRIQLALALPKTFCSIYTLNPEILMQAYRSHEYAKILNLGDINVVDGVGLKLALKFKTGLLFNRICGSDLIFDLAAMAESSNRPILLLGGLPERLQKAKVELQRKYPKLKIVSLSPTFSGNLPLKEQNLLEDLIISTRPSVIAVFLGAPRQETWIAQNRELLLSNDVKVAAGLGGTVDFLSGDIIRAPKWIQTLGFEWAFRLAQEPWRFKRQITNLPEFIFRAIFSQLFVSVRKKSKKVIA